MALRLIELLINQGQESRVYEILEKRCTYRSWHDKVSEKQVCIKILLPSEETGEVLDILEKEFSKNEEFMLILLPVEASIPRPLPPKEADAIHSKGAKNKKNKKLTISREELYSDIEGMGRLSWIFIIQVILSAVVAAVGILYNNIPAIIGAMVIAPLLGPNVALSLATTLGDLSLGKHALKANVLGIVVALLFAALIGFIIDFDTQMPPIIERTRVGFGDVAVALAAGGAAVLSFTTAAPGAVIGVMVAVALLPPLVTMGMLLGAGEWHMASGAALLVLTNLICINLAGVVTFLTQGIRPLRWWDAKKAKKATRLAIMLWTCLLGILIITIVLSQR